MKKVKVWINTGFAGAKHQDVFEYDDDVTDEEINADVMDWVFNKIEYGWCPVEE